MMTLGAAVLRMTNVQRPMQRSPAGVSTQSCQMVELLSCIYGVRTTLLVNITGIASFWVAEQQYNMLGLCSDGTYQSWVPGCSDH